MKLYNTLTRSKEEFKTLEDNKVKMYTCGPTVYNYAHIGNLRMYVSEDVFEKALNYLGYKVERTMNITDVGHLESDADDGDDKMLKGAKRENKSVLEIARFYTDKFFEDCDRLNIKKPENVCKATDFIKEYIEFIKVLEQKGYTYHANGNIYYNISKFPNYTELSKMKLEDLQVASRESVEIDENKKNPQDFVLWFTKSKFENQALKWESPWGVGYPGWHLECSVIAIKTLGERLDVHWGGVDHIAVHHTNEIAQSEAFLGHKWTNYWMHGEHLNNKDGKMSKSSGEFLTLNRLIEKGYNPVVYRFFLLNSHYRKQLEFSYDNLDIANNSYIKLKQRIKDIYDGSNNIEVKENDNILKYRGNFKICLENDLNTANAITVIYDVLKDNNLKNQEKVYLIKEFDEVLSLDLIEYKTVIDSDVKKIEALINERSLAKKNKDFDKADEIRNRLYDMGIEIKDTREGTSWNTRL